MNQDAPNLNPDRWLEEHGDILFRYALARLHNAAASEDVVQETFLAAIKGQERFSGKSTERTWLVGILKHKIVDYIRKASRESSYDDVQIAVEMDKVSDDYFDRKGHWKVKPFDWDSQPRESFEQKEFMEVLRHCLSTLPKRISSVFVLRELEGKDAEEICKILSISTTNLWVMLYRARMGLKSCLEKNWVGGIDSDQKKETS